MEKQREGKRNYSQMISKIREVKGEIKALNEAIDLKDQNLKEDQNLVDENDLLMIKNVQELNEQYKRMVLNIEV